MDRASYTSVIDTPDIIHAQQMRNIVSQVDYRNEPVFKRFLSKSISWRSASIQISHCLCLQKKYREEADRTMSHYVPVLDTPEMQRVRENQKNFSTVSNKCKWWTMLALWGQYVFERCRTYSMKSEDGVRWLRVCCKVLNFIESSWKLNVWCQFFFTQSSRVCFTR